MNEVIRIDPQRAVVEVESADGTKSLPFASQEAFDVVSRAWVRVGWDVKHVYTFSWLGRPIIQLPEDMFRIQEVIFSLRPDVLIETGVAHGGSLIFYASLMQVMGQGRVIGVDVDIRPHNRSGIEAHPLAGLITLIEGDSVADDVLEEVREEIKSGDSVLVLLDSNHSKEHVLSELRAYAPLVSLGSYIVAADGVMADLAGAPRSAPDWSWNNPHSAAREFVDSDPRFKLEDPSFAFNESLIQNGATHWPGGWIRRIAP